MALDIGSVFSGFGDFFSMLGTIFSVIFVFAGFALLGFFLYREMQFKLPVIIHKVLDGGNVVEYKDRARKIKKNGQNELKFKKFKDVVANPPSDYYLKTNKGEKLYFRWDGGHVYVPQKVVYNSPLQFEPGTYNILNQMAWRVKSAAERHKHKSFWDMYGAIVVWLVVIVLIAVVMIVMFSKLEGVANAINNLATATSQISNSQVIS